MTHKSHRIDRRTSLKLMGGAAAALSMREFASSAQAAIPPEIQPFEINVSDKDLDDLELRLSLARWPKDSPGERWEYGTDREYLKELIEYWRNKYDWRAHEAELNRFEHFKTTIDGQLIHFVHHKGKGDSPLPLLLCHGWPGTFWELLPSVRGLSNPEAHGGKAGDSFDVVLPSIPGFGYSGLPQEGTNMRRTAGLWAKLMARLGYDKFGAYGSDWGRGILSELGARYSDHIVGIIRPGHPPTKKREPETDAERAYVASGAKWGTDETGYQRIQGTKPQTLSYGLTDSPVGLAGWITEKLQSWSDCHGDVETRFTKDQILTLLSIYWHTRTIGTSVRYYYANGYWRSGANNPYPGEVKVPQGYVDFPGMSNRLRPPKSFLDKLPPNVIHWTRFDSGGHFPGIEEPELLVGDLRKFFRGLRG